MAAAKVPAKKKASGTPVRKTPAARKTASTKSSAKKVPAKSSSAKHPPAKKLGKGRYGPAASKSVEREMKAMHEGKLRSGGGGEKVTNPKQAIAIGLSEARRAGAKVPPPPARKK